MKAHAFIRIPKTAVALIALVVVLAACHKTAGDSNMAPQNEAFAELISNHAQFQTICFGRFIVEVPAGAEIMFGRIEFDAEIDYLANMYPSLDSIVEDEISKIEKDRYLLGSRKERFPRYGEVIRGKLPGQRTVLGSTDRVSYKVVSFVPKEPHVFVLSLGGTRAENADIALANEIAEILRPRTNTDIPTEPGFCIDGGFIPSSAEYENIEIGFRFKQLPDIHFSIRVLKNQQHLNEGSMLEERIASANDDASPGHRFWLSRINYLRRGHRTLASWSGEEVLTRLPSQQGAKTSHQFHFKSLGKENDPMQPQIDIELVSGVKLNERGAVVPSLSDEQMIELWDRLTSTLRPRPTVAPPAPLEIKAALGTPLMTGRLCPQTGWWECNEVGVISDERRKFIKEGERMPHTLKTYQQSLWEKLVGASPLRRGPAQWELVSYDGPDQPTTQDIPPG